MNSALTIINYQSKSRMLIILWTIFYNFQELLTPRSKLHIHLIRQNSRKNIFSKRTFDRDSALAFFPFAQKKVITKHRANRLKAGNTAPEAVMKNGQRQEGEF